MRLKRLSLATEDVTEAENRFDMWLCNHDATPNEQSLQLRRADARARQDRLTDLLVDGTITKADYDLRRQNSTFELARLEEELRRLSDLEKSRHDLKELVHLAVDLPTAFEAGTEPERRKLLRNCFTKIELSGKRLRTKPAAWLHDLRRMEPHTATAPSDALIQQISRS
jgi:hypothetical protein